MKCPEKVIELKNLELDIKGKLGEITISERFKDWAIKHLHELRKTEVDSDTLVLKGKHKELEDVIKNLQPLTLNKSRQAVEDELEKVRTSKVSSNKRQNPTNCEVLSLELRDQGSNLGHPP